MKIKHQNSSLFKRSLKKIVIGTAITTTAFNALVTMCYALAQAGIVSVPVISCLAIPSIVICGIVCSMSLITIAILIASYVKHKKTTNVFNDRNPKYDTIATLIQYSMQNDVTAQNTINAFRGSGSPFLVSAADTLERGFN